MTDARMVVAVVDDDDGIRRSLHRALTARGYDVALFPSAADFITNGSRLNTACVLADIWMPDIDGFALQKLVRARDPDLPIVFMTALDDVDTVVRAMKGGAADVLAKPFTNEALYRAIDAAIATARAAGTHQHALASLWRCLERLSPREAEIVALVASGMLNKQIGAALGIREKTVKVHRSHAMHKLGAESLPELVRMVDQAMAHRRRDTIHVDGIDVVRPAAVAIMARALRDPEEIVRLRTASFSVQDSHLLSDQD